MKPEETTRRAISLVESSSQIKIGDSETVREANAADRAALIEALRGQTFLIAKVPETVESLALLGAPSDVVDGYNKEGANTFQFLVYEKADKPTAILRFTSFINTDMPVFYAVESPITRWKFLRSNGDAR